MEADEARDPRLEPYAGTDTLGRAREVRHDRSPLAQADRPRAPGVSVVVLTLDRADLTVPLARTLAGRARSALAERDLGFELVIGDTGSSESRLLDFYREPPAGVRPVRGLDYHFGRCNNALFAEHTRFDTVLFLNNDVRLPDGPAPLLALRDALEETGGGVAGHVLHYPDGRVQHAGIDFHRWGPARGLSHHPGAGVRRPPASFPRRRRVPAVTGACLMIGASLFRRCGGFDPGYRVECQDVDLCLRAHRLGEPTVRVSAGEVVHLENATRPAGDAHWPDRRRLLRRWSGYVATRFPEPLRP